MLMQVNDPEVQKLVSYSETVHTAEYAQLPMLLEAAESIPDNGYISSTLKKMSEAEAEWREIGFGHSIWSEQRAPRPTLQLVLDAYQHFQHEHDPTRARELCRYIGEFVLPLSGIPEISEGREFDLYRHDNVDRCGKAEPHFYETLEQVTSNTWYGQPHISVYHDTSGTPLMIRKSIEGSTALTLQPFQLYDMQIPIGSIVKPSRAMNFLKTGEVKRGSGETGMTYSTYWIKRIPEIALGRVSAMAYGRPLDRQLFALDVCYPKHRVIDNDQEKMQQLERMDIQAFQDAARKVMLMCGIRPPQPNVKEMVQLGIANTIGYIRDSLVEPADSHISIARKNLKLHQQSSNES